MASDAAALREIASATVARYSERFARHGYDARSLGWGSAEQQRYRFAQTLAGPVDLRGRSLLDLGCGFGDYRSFLADAGVPVQRYAGWDVNPDLIAEARKRHAGDGETRFEVRDLMSGATEGAGPVADVGIMLGTLNFNLSARMDNYAYSELAIRRAWSLVGRALIVDFLSVRRVPDHPPESWVFHHEPERMLGLALDLSPRVTLKHDYRPIPQREFMLFIERE